MHNLINETAPRAACSTKSKILQVGSYRGGGGVGYAVKQPKNDSPQN